MQWSDFYDNFWDWSDSTRRTRISALKDIGTGEEIVEVVIEINDEKVKAQLIRKAIKLGAHFTQSDFANLDGELPDDVYAQLGHYAGFDSDNPHFDEECMSWEDFYNAYSGWDEPILSRRVKKLRNFGPSDEVAEVIQCMPNENLENLLYKNAVSSGVKFTTKEKEEMGFWGETIHEALEDTLTDERIDQHASNAGHLVAARKKASKSKMRTRFWGVLIGIGSGLAKAGKRRNNSRYCDGDCANCPAHYGYRYGRWYYGHGHQHGCERGGNGGKTGKTSRD